jgi:hypothetical protein
MTEITPNHVKWAVADRLRLMLVEEPPHSSFNVTQTYAFFTTILCWVMQHIRIGTHEISDTEDKIAHKLFKRFSQDAVHDDPWRVHVAPTKRIERIGSSQVPVLAPVGFETHTVERFLTNLRDATAHGDARNVRPFNVDSQLAGFRFNCAEFKDRKKTWEGSITLLEQDMRRIGANLAKTYCNALRRSERHRRDSHFERDAAAIKETAAAA